MLSRIPSTLIVLYVLIIEWLSRVEVTEVIFLLSFYEYGKSELRLWLEVLRKIDTTVHDHFSSQPSWLKPRKHMVDLPELVLGIGMIQGQIHRHLTSIMGVNFPIVTHNLLYYVNFLERLIFYILQKNRTWKIKQGWGKIKRNCPNNRH